MATVSQTLSKLNHQSVSSNVMHTRRIASVGTTEGVRSKRCSLRHMTHDTLPLCTHAAMRRVVITEGGEFRAPERGLLPLHGITHRRNTTQPASVIPIDAPPTNSILNHLYVPPGAGSAARGSRTRGFGKFHSAYFPNPRVRKEEIAT